MPSINRFWSGWLIRVGKVDRSSFKAYCHSNKVNLYVDVATLEECDLSFRSVNHQFTLPVKATKGNKSELLAIDNPNYSAIINKNPHLRGVYVHDEDEKA